MGIRAMLIGMIILSFVAYFINSYYSGRLVNYPVREQIADILPSFVLALAVSCVVYSLTFILKYPSCCLIVRFSSLY